MKVNVKIRHIGKFIQGCLEENIKIEVGVIFAESIFTKSKKDSNGNFLTVH